MARNIESRDPTSTEFATLSDLQDFWDTHSLADHEDQFRDVHFNVDLRSRKNLIAVEPALLKELVKNARGMGVSTETLVNLWLSRQLQESQSPSE